MSFALFLFFRLWGKARAVWALICCFCSVAPSVSSPSPLPLLFIWTNQGKYLPSINKYYHSSCATHSHNQLNLLTKRNQRQNFICKFDRLICNKIFQSLSPSLSLSTRPGNVFFRELQNFRMSSGFFLFVSLTCLDRFKLLGQLLCGDACDKWLSFS